MYESEGMYPAESFFGINDTNGAITNIRAVSQDSLITTEYQVGHSVLVIIIFKMYKPNNLKGKFLRYPNFIVSPAKHSDT